MAAVAENASFQRIGLIKHVSPSRAAALLACSLSEAFRASNSAPRLPTHPRAHFGILAHTFLRDASRGLFSEMSEFALKEVWRSRVKSYEEGLGRSNTGAAVLPLMRSCRDFEVNSLRLIRSVATYVLRAPRSPGEDQKRQSTEAEAASIDGKIVGRLDRIAWQNGELFVTDIKTGKTSDPNGRLRKELRIQIMLYGYLVHEKFGQWPRILRVLPLHGDPVEVNASPSEITSLANGMRQALEKANSHIGEILAGRRQETDLASPSPEACRYCSFRLTCDAYWAAKQKHSNQGWPRDLSGSITAIIPLGNAITVTEIGGDVKTTRVIRGLPNSVFSKVRHGVHIRVCDLKAERAAGVYSWRPNSFLWQAQAAELAPI
jgi:RecB family exonuclease